MDLGIMQPYFFPYIGYYSLIKHTDKWIVFDTVQFIRHGWIERNRVLKPNDGWQYLSVPLQKHDREILIKDVQIRQEEWREKMLRQLEHYKKAPFYESTMEVIKESLAIETKSITELNAHILSCTCAYLGVDFKYDVFSRMNLAIDEVHDAGEWALNIAKAYGANGYVNPPGGMELFDNEKFKKAGIELKFLKANLQQYSQRRPAFEPGLSIIDVMMFNDAKQINAMLDNYEMIYS